MNGKASTVHIVCALRNFVDQAKKSIDFENNFEVGARNLTC